MSERDKFLTEAMGECFHEWKWISGCGRNCKNCDIDLYGPDNTTYQQIIETPENTNFSTWEGFGKLWEWAVDQDWFDKFTTWSLDRYYKSHSHEMLFHVFNINPDRFATAIYLYLNKETP